MNCKRFVPIAVGAFALVGCAHPEFDAAQAAAAARTQNVRITCADAADCSVKWGRALQWVSQTSFYKIRIATDSLITTEGPIDDVGYSTKSALTINKMPLGDGSAEISFQSGCANEFGCVPTHEMLLASFADYVGVSPAIAPAGQAMRRSLGVHYAALNPQAITALHVTGDHGLFVGAVDAGSPAATAGLQKGDVILSFGNRNMSSTADLQQAMESVSAGAAVPIHIWRDGQELDLTVRF
jgi:membrane-associated protease RseP (regulator of RpoE activity)